MLSQSSYEIHTVVYMAFVLVASDDPQNCVMSSTILVWAIGRAMEQFVIAY